MCFCCRPNHGGLSEAAAQQGSEGSGGGGGGGVISTSTSSSNSAAVEDAPLPEEGGAGDAPAGGGGVVTGRLPTPPYVHLVFLRSHPQFYAQQFLQAFAAVHAQGLVHRPKAVRLL